MDVGGSMYIWTFGAFFGVGIAALLNFKEGLYNRNFITNTNSNHMALIGTLFLWCFFPTFNSILAENNVTAHMAVLNTYFCLIGSLVGTYFTSKILYEGKFHVEHLINSTLVGGVIMAAGANIL